MNQQVRLELRCPYCGGFLLETDAAPPFVVRVRCQQRPCRHWLLVSVPIAGQVVIEKTIARAYNHRQQNSGI